MTSIPQDAGNRYARTLYAYESCTCTYDEMRGLPMLYFNSGSLPVELWPVCTDCGMPARLGYVSTDGDDSVVYCDNCVYRVVAAD